MPVPPPRTRSSSDIDLAAAERAVEAALKFAQARLGLGWGTSVPGWVRDRVLAVLKERAARQGVSLEQAAAKLDGDESAIDDLEGALRVGETRFHRDPDQWKVIEQIIVRSFPARATLNVLSAGCSTGEEAYTAAMMLRSARRNFHVLGIDRSGTAIAKARKAVYSPDAVRDLPAAYLTRYCEFNEEHLRVRNVITESVTFRQGDLVHSIPSGPYHIVFFKNVLLYLAEPTGEQIATRLVNELHESGYLFTAASEVVRLKEAGLNLARVAPGVTAFRKHA